MSHLENKSGGFSDEPSICRDRVPDMARSLVCEGQTGGVLAGTPFGDASVGRSGGDGPLPETSLFSSCKGTSIIEKIDDIEEIEMDEDLNATFTDKLNGCYV
ncbi:hypothetical protein PUN28_020782 [Cardiocondyla obscurior]|uniref:Uncharacterized protein n=1 Tax=Cardiocondyla obscurior TaxID=286306 RepID=A0AAW2E6D7_9HYME